jgi:hypothetical protein
VCLRLKNVVPKLREEMTFPKTDATARTRFEETETNNMAETLNILYAIQETPCCRNRNPTVTETP